MVYISKEDITANIQETMLQSSIENDSGILDTLERQVIDEVRDRKSVV